MNNFVIDTTVVEDNFSDGIKFDSYILLYIEDKEIKFDMKCMDGDEVSMAILLASIQTKECYDNVLAGVDMLDNADAIYENHNIVMETLGENPGELDFDEDDLAPMMHPVCVYNNADEAMYKDDE
jgi:hypothetical protein